MEERAEDDHGEALDFARGLRSMRPVSLRRQRENRIRARLRAGLGAVACEAKIEGMCTGMAQDWHERLSRARGGSVIDVENRVMLCRACHSHITVNPVWSAEHGWSLSALGGRG